MNAIATKAIIFNVKGKVLIINKSVTEKINPKTIDIPGGRLEFGENPEDGLKREVLEEVGLEIDIIAPSRVWSMTKDDLYLVGITFSTICKNGKAEINLSDEHESFVWLSVSDIQKGEYPIWVKDEVRNALTIKRRIK